MMCHDVPWSIDPIWSIQARALPGAAAPAGSQAQGPKGQWNVRHGHWWHCIYAMYMQCMVLLIFLLVSSSLFRPLDKFLCDAGLLSYVVVYCVFHASCSYSIFWIPLGLLVLALCWFVCLVLLFREHPSCQPKPQKSLNLSRFPSMRIHMGKVKKRVGMRALWHHKVYNVARHHPPSLHKISQNVWLIVTEIGCLSDNSAKKRAKKQLPLWIGTLRSNRWYLLKSNWWP